MPTPTAPPPPKTDEKKAPKSPLAPAGLPPVKTDEKDSVLRERLGIKKKTPAPPKPPTPPTPAPAKKKPAELPPVVAPSLSTETIAGAVTAGVKEALKPPPPPTPDPFEGLTPEIKRRVQVLERMEKNDPAQKGLANQYIAAQRKLNEYKKTWEEKHPGQSFDIAGDEHADFLKQNDVNWEEDSYLEALADLRAEGAVSKVTEKYDKKLKAADLRERERVSQPAMFQHRATTAKVLFNTFSKAVDAAYQATWKEKNPDREFNSDDPEHNEFGKVLDEHGQINNAEVQRLIAENPFYADVFAIAQHVEEVAGEIFRIAHGFSELEAKDNPPELQSLHREIIGFIFDQEKKMKALPADQQRNGEGKMFATSAEWEKLTEDQRKNYWHFVDTDLSALFAFEQAKQAKKIIEVGEDRAVKIAEKRGWKVPESGKTATGQSNTPVGRPSGNQPLPPNTPLSPPGILAPRLAPGSVPEKGENSTVLNRITGRK